MRLEEHPLYREDIRKTADLKLPWEKMQGCHILISGATGMIGSFLADTLMERNRSGLDCTVWVMGRNEKKARERFSYCWEDPHFRFLCHDVNRELVAEDFERMDYVVHLASNTHPVAYATDPINTINMNVIGTHVMLSFAQKVNAKRVAFASSNEIYGENRGDREFFDESYCGYIDCNTLRAGYPESKRCGEALCQAYIKQYGMDIVIPRFTRSYGPTLLSTDTKALSQFLGKGLAGEDIVLKSAGTQYYSYTYVSDAVAGLLTVLLKGETGEAYNIADEKSDIMLKDLAGIIAELSGKKVVFDLPDAVEAAGFSKATKARLDGAKIRELGWRMEYDMREGLDRTLRILRDVRG